LPVPPILISSAIATAAITVQAAASKMDLCAKIGKLPAFFITTFPF
jgi:hypothetical protein